MDFSPDFEERTLQSWQPCGTSERQNKMSMIARKITLLAAAAVVLLAVTVSAAVLWLTPPRLRRN